MTITGIIEKEIEVPDGVMITISGNTVSVKGPNGSIERSFDLHRIQLIQEDAGKLVVKCEYPRMRDKAMIGTISSHIQNMVHGVQKGFEFKMKIVYSHFPIKASIKGDRFVIENFLGERHERNASIVGATSVNVKGDEVVLNGISIEEVGQTAANIEQATKIRGFDNRVFQDGIYIVKKGRRGDSS